MGFFDNVRSSLTETSQDLTQKAKDTTEIFRLGNLNSYLSDWIKVLFRTAGRMYGKISRINNAA